MAGDLVGCIGCGKRLVPTACNALTSVRSRPSPRSCSFFSLAKNSCQFLLGQSLDHSLFSKRNAEVRVAADYSDSKPESFNRHGKWSYHPLEDLSKGEKEEIEHAGDKKLTNAELARTISEVNWSAFIYSSVISDKDAVHGTEVQYIVDAHGDLYFEVENDDVFLHNLSSSQIYTVLVGFGNADLIQFSEVVEFQGEEGTIEIDSDVETSDDSENSDIEIYWEDVDGFEGGDGDSAQESFGSLGGWGGAKSLSQVHPMDFASKVSESVSTDHTSEIDMPARRLSITGVARPIREEELSYVQGIWYDRFSVVSSDDHSSDVDEGDYKDDEEGEDGDGSVNEDDDLDVGKDNVQRHNGDDQFPAANIMSVNFDHKSWRPGNDQIEEIIDVENSERQQEGLQNGLDFGMCTNGSTVLPCEEDLKTRNNPFGASEQSSNDQFVDLSNRSSVAEDVDVLRDAYSDESEVVEGGMVSKDLGKRQNRRKMRGSILENSGYTEEALELEAEEPVLPPGATMEGDAAVSEWIDQNIESEGSSFFKLEIGSIQLNLGPGLQLPVEVQEFAHAEPDILAHFSTAIIDRVNNGGKKTEDALKALCHRAKGLDAEEVSLISVDCLGVDVRVWSGIEVQTVRIPFSKRATCEDTADKLIDQLLFPRYGRKRPRRRG